jgi:hypothetical protein
MRTLLFGLSLAFLVLASAGGASAQWHCLYATWDDETNGTGSNTLSVGVIGEDTFVALVSSGRYSTTENVLIPYVNADSATGRRDYYGYGGEVTGIYQVWTDGGFDQVQMLDAFQIAADKDSFIYVANNDLNHNILVFRFQGDTVQTVDVGGIFPRQETGANRIWGVEVDANGYVYVCTDTSTGISDDLKVYPPIENWTAFHTDNPLTTIDLPDGLYKGITASSDGSAIWVCDWGNRTILKYVGSPATGYTADPGFQFALQADDTLQNETSRPGPLALKLLEPNNILFVAVDTLFGQGTGTGYDFGRIYLLDANTGELVDQDRSVSLIDVAQWNFDLTGAYNDRTNGTVPGNASGYTSTYDVEIDEAGNVYSQSYFGWTVEKWTYDGELPVVTSVEPIERTLPGEYRLNQNYPNPFNPATTIEFSVPLAGPVRLVVYDLLGRTVATLVDEVVSAGSYRVTFDARDLPSGTYLYTLRSAGASLTQRMILLK